MTHSSSFYRKIAYIVAMALLLIPLAIMSRPATTKRGASGGREREPGGVLAEMRNDAGLSQAQLGAIDPASETMKLATFGLRGVAVVLLWDRANEYKKKEDWDNFSATLEQIGRLQPNFITVWEHQAHNMSYNVSVEFDDYKQRYHWVKKGIDYLIEGTEFNHNEPRLLWYTGWVVGQKIGRADERVQFRRLFKDDHELERTFARLGIDVESARGLDGKPDNWLMGRLWYERAIQAKKAGGSIGGKSPVLFYSSPVMSLVNFAGDLEKEPDFDEAYVQSVWARAYQEWMDLGNLPLPSSGGKELELNKAEVLQSQIKDEADKLDALLPGIRQLILDEKTAALPPDFRRVLKKPEAERTDAERASFYKAQELTQVSHFEVAQRAPTDNSVEARRIATGIAVLQEQLHYTVSSRNVVNFDFWRDRSRSGATPVGTAARKHLYEARQLASKPDFPGAKAKYEQSFAEWAEIFKDYPSQKADADNEELIKDVEAYMKVLTQLDLRDASGGILPPDFPLTELLREQGHEDLLKFRQAEPEHNKPEDNKPEEPTGKPAEPTEKPAEPTEKLDEPEEPADDK